MATDENSTVPSLDILTERLEALRFQLFRAHGICGSVAYALQCSGDSDCERVSANGGFAIEAVARLIDDIAGALDPEVLLRAETAEAEGGSHG